MGLALMAGLLAAPATTTAAFADTPTPLGKPHLDAPHPVKVTPLTLQTNESNGEAVRKAEASDRAAAARATADQHHGVIWPTAGSAHLTAPAHGTAHANPGHLPITLSRTSAHNTKKATVGAASATVRVLDRQETNSLGIKGVVLAVTAPAAGSPELGIDYSAFASAYGGDWAGRLHVAKLPDCALDHPSRSTCRRQTPLPTTNDRRHQQTRTQLHFAPSSTPLAGRTMLLALAAGTTSGAGDYKATPLSSSSTWESGGSSGTFTWSYPLRTPTAADGPAPDLSLTYDSGAVDGQTASTNNQGTTVGTGFDVTSSYVERKYGSCDDDGQDKKYDLCWKYDNASLVLGGKSSELVKDDTTGAWHLKNDDASTVTHSTGADNGDDNGEYWTVTTGEGTKYVFGLNKLDGAGTSDRTNSVWTVPVFGDDEGEPGYSDGTTFSGRDKNQAWRWNLDYVEDTHGNAMSYWYTAETNNYDKLGDDTTGTRYTRGGYLNEIRYGQRAGALFDATPAASDKVVFSYAERCTAPGTGCDSLTEDTRDNWPDVPFDTVCKDGDKCTGNAAPAFFTRKRMTGITTYAWNAAATTPGFEKVDSWSLKQEYLDPGDTGDSSDQSLWLDEINHTGEHGTAITVDPLKFSHTFLPNRVDSGSDDILPLNKPRLKDITTETGAETNITYMDADCVAGQSRPKPDANTSRCYPVYWSPNGEKDPILDWFQKYPVHSVLTSDPYGGSEAVQHTYTYSGGGAWHYNDDPLTKEKERTWSIWRGFATVTDTTGLPGKTQSKTTTVYFRGMDGDRLLGSDGKTPDTDKRKSATVSGIKAGSTTDLDQYAGFTRETVTYNGAQEVSGQINDLWSKKTATQHKSYADTESYFVRAAATHTRTNITTNGTSRDRTRTTVSTFDDYGLTSTVEDRGDDDVTGDETCARTWYARNDDLGINNLVSRTRTVAQPCATADTALDLPVDSSRPGDVISDIATAYDTATTWSATQKPTQGEARWTGRAKAYGTDNEPTWQKITTTTYDTLGRPLTVKNTNDTLTTSTTYTPTAAGPLTTTAVANAKSQTTTTKLDFATGSTLKITDPNSKITETEYDSLDRVTKVWLPTRQKLLSALPNYTYAYHLDNHSLPYVATSTAGGNGGYNTTYEIYDSLLRPRQTQSPSASGGTIVTQTLYDERGLATTTQADIWADTIQPSGNPVQVAGGSAPTETDTTYDGAERAVKTETKNFSTTRWTTQTIDTGDTVTTTAPTGGQATAVVTNALGQTTERRDYAGTQPTGTDFTTTRFTYDPAARQRTVTGPDQTKWSYTYDLFGRQTSTADPDKGTTTTTYNELDQAVTSTDARGKSLVTEYDVLGRKTGLWDGTKTDGTKLAAWTFDTLAKGQPDASTRYDGGLTGKAYTSRVTKYDPLYKPQTTELDLPDNDPLVQAGVPKAMTLTTGYNIDGTINQTSNPAVGGLPSETVSYTYDNLGEPLKTSGSTGYGLGATYSPIGDLRQLTLGTDPTTSAKKAYLNYDYEPGTRRLTRSYVTDDIHGYMPQELKYTQDDAGNVTSVFDGTTQGGATKTDYQCFTYDGQRRLNEAWTPQTPDCATTGRTTSNIDGAAPYWASYTYNNAGERTTETQHTTTGDQTTDYTYGTAAQQPHPLTKTTGTKTGNYTYDKDGNTTSRPGTQAQQTLTWNTEGQLATATEPTAGTKAAKGTSYLYDTTGQLLISRNTTGDGDTVLYLGATEIRLTTNGDTKALSATRYYTAAGQTIAVRTATSGIAGSQLAFLAEDPHGTAGLALAAGTYAVTKRYTTPFGAPRGTDVVNWPDDKGFLGKPSDATTGLTHIGAREYDPTTGLFLSVDPLLQTDIAQSLNGYTYGSNNPLTFTDPTGQGLACSPTTTPCPHRPDGSVGVGVPNEAVDYDHPGPVHPCNSGCTGTSSNKGSGQQKHNDSGSILSGFKHFGSQFVDNVDSGFYGVVRNAPDLASNFGFIWDSDCWNGGAGAPGCDYAATYDKYLESQGIDTNSSAYTVPSFVAAIFGQREGGAGLGCRFSFTPSTEVLMGDGKTKEIEAIKVGDEVQAGDEDTGKHKGPRQVTATHINHDDDLVDLTIQTTPHHTAVLHTTSAHPFWDDTTHKWVPAGELTPGHLLITEADRHAKIAGIRAIRGAADMYNLTVNDVHTYYVLAGDTPVLVHNTNSPIGCGSAGEPIYDIPAGSSGGLGAGKKIPPSLLKDYDVGKNAEPGSITPLCSYCRTNPATAIDHVEPRIGGGDLTDANTTPACTFCNSSKRDRLAPLNMPPNYTGSYPPPWWPSRMTPP